MTGCVTDPAEPEDNVVVDGKGDGPTGGLARVYGLELTSVMRLEDDRETDPAKRFTTFDLRARAMVTTKQTGEDVQLTLKLCDTRLPTVGGYQPELDPGLIASLEPIVLSGSLHGGRLSTDPAAIVLGAALSNPVMDALPTTKTDSRVRDQDRDGEPGVSIKISVGRIYSAMRVLIAIDGPVNATAAITGDAEIRLDQAILGDSIPFFDAAGSLAESQPHIQVRSSENKFRMKSNAATCAQVAAAFP